MPFFRSCAVLIIGVCAAYAQDASSFAIASPRVSTPVTLALTANATGSLAGLGFIVFLKAATPGPLAVALRWVSIALLAWAALAGWRPYVRTLRGWQKRKGPVFPRGRWW